MKLANPPIIGLAAGRDPKEPLGPMVAHGDDQCVRIVKGVRFCDGRTGRIGVTQKNVRRHGNRTARAEAGVSARGNLGEQLGLHKEDVTDREAVGNYGESSIESRLPAQSSGLPRAQPALDQGRKYSTRRVRLTKALRAI